MLRGPAEGLRARSCLQYWESIRVITLVLVWWIASSFANVFSKRAVAEGVPFLSLCVVQFALGSLLAFASMTVEGSRIHEVLHHLLRFPRRALVLSLSHVVGTTTANASMAAGSATTTQVVKATEPGLSVLLKWGVTGRLIGGAPLLSLGCVVVGVVLLCGSHESATSSNVLLALISGIAFSSRNVVMSDPSLDEVPRSAAESFFIMSSLGFLLALGVGLIDGLNFAVFSSSSAITSGLLHALYNLMSTKVLELVTVESHALLNVSKRVVGIVVLAVVLRDVNPSPASFVGFFVAVAGLFGYAVSKKRADRDSTTIGSGPEAPSSTEMFRAGVDPARTRIHRALLASVSLLALFVILRWTVEESEREEVSSLFSGPASKGSVMKNEGWTSNGIERVVLHGYYEGYLGKDNLGDEILFDQAAQMIGESLSLRWGVPFQGISFTANLTNPHDPSLVRQDSRCSILNERTPLLYQERCLDFAILGGGSIMLPWHVSKFSVTPAAELPVFLFGTGFQDLVVPFRPEVVDALVARVHSAGSSPELTSEEIERVCPALRFVDQRMRFGGTRGFLSREVVRTCAPTFNLPVLYDAGLLAGRFFAPRQDFLAFLRGVASSQQTIIPVNFFRCGIHYCKDREGSVSSAVIDALSHLLSLDPSLSFVLYAMEPGQRGDLEFLKSALTARGISPDRVVLEPFSLSFGDVLELHRGAPFSFSMKLHSMILSAAVGTPFLNVAYLFKAIDFADSVEMLDFVLHARMVTSASLRSLVDRMLEDSFILRGRLSETLHEHIRQGNDAYQAAFHRFFDAIVSERRVDGCSTAESLSVKAHRVNLGGEVTIVCSQQ